MTYTISKQDFILGVSDGATFYPSQYRNDEDCGDYLAVPGLDFPPETSIIDKSRTDISVMYLELLQAICDYLNSH